MALKIDRGLVLKNSLLNILGGLAPMTVSLSTLPTVLRLIGAERYGILSLALVVTGYFGVLDLGLGQAATKFVAEALGRGDEEAVPPLFWTTVLAQLSLGAVGGVLLAALTPWLVDRWLTIPAAYQADARASLYVMAAGLPLFLAQPSFSGVLEAAQRFDLANLVGVPAAALMPLAMYVGARRGMSLAGIMLLLVLGRLALILVLLAMCARVFPGIRRTLGVTRASFGRLLRFGGWFTAGGLIIPILLYEDRFMLGRYLSMSDVTYYAVPFGLMTRMWLLPQSLSRVLFPAFSTLRAEDQEQLEQLYLRSFKYMALIAGLTVIPVAALSSDLMLAWLGPETGPRCAEALRLLLYGAFFSMLGPIAATLLQGTGRPDVVTKWYAACLPLNAVGVWALVRWGGLTGAAISYDVRAAAEVLVFAVAAARLSNIPLSSLRRHRLTATLLSAPVLAALLWTVPRAPSLGGRALAGAAGCAAFAAFGWLLMLDEADTRFIKDQLTLKLSRKAAPACSPG